MTSASTDAPPRRRPPLTAFLELLALTGFAVAQPLLDVFGRSPEQFAFRDASRPVIIVFGVLIALAPAVGLSPAAVAFASTAAAGFCHTLPSSAKPVALFAKVEDTETYSPRDLLRLSAVLAPVSAGLVLLFSVAVWPLLGLPLRT